MVTPSQDSTPCEMKRCNRCGGTKPITEFYMRGYRSKRNAGRKSASNECKECTKDRTRSRYYGPMYVENKQKANGLAKRRREQIKAIVFGKYSGSEGIRCACCGETELIFLTLDHINNDGAQFRKNQFGRQTAAGYTTYSWLLKHGCPGGFQVLCANCQHGKRMNNGVCPHRIRCNDYPVEGVGSSDPKRGEPILGYDIVSSVAKVTAASRFLKDLRELIIKHDLVELENDLDADLRLATQIED
jgi:hypothetical protein